MLYSTVTPLGRGYMIRNTGDTADTGDLVFTVSDDSSAPASISLALAGFGDCLRGQPNLDFRYTELERRW